MTIGSRFRKLRIAIGLTQEEIGEICEVTKGMVSMWESDISTPTVDRLTMLKKRANFSLDWLIAGEGDMLPVRYYVSDPKLVAALKIMQSLPEYGKDSALKELNEVSELIEHTKRASPQ